MISDFRSVQDSTDTAEFISYQIGFLGASSLRIGLSSDPAFSWVESSVSWTRRPAEGEEAFWRVADLTGVDFQFLPQVLERRYDPREFQIGYLRLVPLEKADLRRSPSGLKPTRTAGAVIDGHEMFGAHGPTSTFTGFTSAAPRQQ